MLKEYLTSIANAMRSKLGGTDKINAQNFPDKIGEVYKAGQLKILQDSEYMNAKVSGTAIAVNDVSPIEHSVGCSVASKNLIPYSRFNPTQTINGITFTNNADGSVTLNGTATAESVFACVNSTKSISLKAGTYTLSGGINTTIWIQGKIIEDDGFVAYNQTKPAPFTFNENVSFRFNIRVSSGTVCENVVIKPQLEKGTTATEYTPYVEELGGIEVSRYGKNLLSPDIGDFANWTPLENEITKCYYFDLPIGTYTFSCELMPDKYLGYFYLHKSNDKWVTKETVYIIQTTPTVFPCIFTIEKGYEYRFWWYGNLDYFRHYSSFQIEKGTTATSYEPYIEPTTYTAKADGTVENVKSISPNMTLLTNNNGVVINANYLRDIDTYIDNLKTNVALTGGE